MQIIKQIALPKVLEKWCEYSTVRYSIFQTAPPWIVDAIVSAMIIKAKAYHQVIGYKTNAALMRVLNHGDYHDERMPFWKDLVLKYK